MLTIHGDLITRTLPKKGMFELDKPMKFHHPLVGHHEIPVGFQTNFASIPRFFRRIFTVNDIHREEAAVHDYLYSSYHKLNYQCGDFFLTRKECDIIFKSGLKKEKLPKWKIWAMYNAVRLFGGFYK